VAIELELPPDAAGERLDVLLAQPLGSRSRAQRLIVAGQVLVDGATVRKNHRVSGGERIVVDETPAAAEAPAAGARVAQFGVAYEDEHLIVVDKPAGVVVHPARGHHEGTLALALFGRAAGGERAWRARLVEALGAGRTRLVDFPVLDRHGRLVHLESPLRVQMEPGGDFLPAARWLPLASRSRLTALVDAHAIGLALQAIAADGRPRGVNVAPSSLSDGGFAAQARRLVEEHAKNASGLWLEVDEAAALAHFDTLQALGRLLRPLGVRFGLEHAGQRLHRVERLYELGLDYVKLDSALCRGVAGSDASRDFVRSSVALLHALSIAVHAEGVESDEDAQALWECGVDGITGPWASTRLSS
jgi:EAL domain-containing protein (putative c-di-GMP-specific phosphodiesterase class I)